MRRVAWVARYTSFTMRDIDELTFKEFEVFCEELQRIIKEESGS